MTTADSCLMLLGRRELPRLRKCLVTGHVWAPAASLVAGRWRGPSREFERIELGSRSGCQQWTGTQSYSTARYTFTNNCPSSVSISPDEKTEASTALRLRHEDYSIDCPVVTHSLSTLYYPASPERLFVSQPTELSV